MSYISKARRGAAAKFERDRQNSRFARAPVVIATEETSGAVVEHDGTAYALEKMALGASESVHIEDQRTATILAQMAGVGYMMAGGAPEKLCWLALQGARINQEVFDGDHSDPLIPSPSGGGKAKTAYFRMTGHVLTVIRMIEKLERVSLDRAAQIAVAWFDDQLNSKLRVRIWQVSFKVERKGASPDVSPATAAEGLADVASKLVRYIKAEEAKTRTDKAMPANSEGATFYATARKLMERFGVKKDLFEQIRLDAFREMVLLTPAAQKGAVSISTQMSEDQNPPDSFASRHQVTFQDRRSRPDITDL